MRRRKESRKYKYVLELNVVFVVVDWKIVPAYIMFFIHVKNTIWVNLDSEVCTYILLAESSWSEEPQK